MLSRNNPTLPRVESGWQATVDSSTGPIRPPAPSRPPAITLAGDRATCHSAPTPREATPASGEAAASILVCEDDPAVAGLVVLTLELDGHEVEHFPSGRTAVQRLQGPIADLLILDIMLPDIDGLELLRSVRADPSWSTAYVVMLTALANDEQIWQGWTHGADYYLTKPFDVHHLTSVVGRLLNAGEL